MVTFPSAADVPPITNIDCSLDPKVGSQIIHVATVVSGPMATKVIWPIMNLKMMSISITTNMIFIIKLQNAVSFYSYSNLDIHLYISVLLDGPFHFFLFSQRLDSEKIRHH